MSFKPRKEPVAVPIFEVLYRDKDRQTVSTGKIGGLPHVKAADVQEVYTEIQSHGGTVLKVQVVSERSLRVFFDRLMRLNISLKFSANTSEYAMLCDVLRALLSAGVPVLRAVRLAAGESANPWLGKKLKRVTAMIEQGFSLSLAMESLGNAFPIVLTSAIRAGEKIGEVPKSLEKMAVLFRRKAEIKRETISALIYPVVAILVFIMVCVVITIKIPAALEDVIGGNIDRIMSQLPRTIQLLFFLKKNPAYMATPFVGIGFLMALVALGKQFRPTRLMIARMARRVPLIGIMRARFALVDFLESVALNQESGIKIGESLELIRRTTSDPLIEDAITRVRERIIAHGRSLSQAMEPETVFPGLVRQMVTAAEAGGHLAEMLRPIAEYYGLQARASLKRMIDFMTPGMIILLGVAIGPVISGVYTTLWMIPKLMGNM